MEYRDEVSEITEAEIQALSQKLGLGLTSDASPDHVEEPPAVRPYLRVVHLDDGVVRLKRHLNGRYTVQHHVPGEHHLITIHEEEPDEAVGFLRRIQREIQAGNPASEPAWRLGDLIVEIRSLQA